MARPVAPLDEKTPDAKPLDAVRPLLRVRQFREFTDERVDDDALQAITDAARWSGSSRNTQPWRFIVVRRTETLRTIAQAGLPQTRSLRTAMAAVAVALPSDPDRSVSHAFDEGRVAERMLIAAALIGVGAGIAWVRSDVRDAVSELLGIPDGWFVRTIVSVGHPTGEARRPKSAPGTARRPRDEMVFDEVWRD